MTISIKKVAIAMAMTTEFFSVFSRASTLQAPNTANTPNKKGIGAEGNATMPMDIQSMQGMGR